MRAGFSSVKYVKRRSNTIAQNVVVESWYEMNLQSSMGMDFEYGMPKRR